MKYRFLAKDEYSLFNKTIREHYNNFPPIIYNDLITAHILIIYKTDSNVPLGYLVLEKKSRDELCIHLLYVFPMYRRMRVASNILDYVLNIFKEKIIYGFCPINNYEAFNFLSTKAKWLSKDMKKVVVANKYKTNIYRNAKLNSYEFILRG